MNKKIRNIMLNNLLRIPKVLEAGLEPARPKEHRILSPACLPIPPLEQATERKTGFEPATLTLAR